MFKGCYTAIVTPFKNEKVDYKSLEKLIEFQNNSNVSGIVCCGSTGEGSVLETDEYIEVIKFCVEKTTPEKRVIVGFGTNSTYKSLKMLEKLNKMKLDGLLTIVPYYNKPTQKGIIEHFKTIASNTRHKIILYNIPSRTGVNMLAKTVNELSQFKNIAAIKEASGNLDQISEIINTTPNIDLLSGDDTLTLPMMSVGAKGVISVASNIIPDEISLMCESFEKGNIRKVFSIHHKYFKFIKSMFIETNPIPIKYILKKKKIIESDELRLPLIRISKENSEYIDKIMKEIKL